MEFKKSSQNSLIKFGTSYISDNELKPDIDINHNSSTYLIDIKIFLDLISIIESLEYWNKFANEVAGNLLVFSCFLFKLFKYFKFSLDFNNLILLL